MSKNCLALTHDSFTSQLASITSEAQHISITEYDLLFYESAVFSSELAWIFLIFSSSVSFRVFNRVITPYFRS